MKLEKHEFYPFLNNCSMFQQKYTRIRKPFIRKKVMTRLRALGEHVLIIRWFVNCIGICIPGYPIGIITIHAINTMYAEDLDGF
jgi:hypothetical protein